MVESSYFFVFGFMAALPWHLPLKDPPSCSKMSQLIVQIGYSSSVAFNSNWDPHTEEGTTVSKRSEVVVSKQIQIGKLQQFF